MKVQYIKHLWTLCMQRWKNWWHWGHQIKCCILQQLVDKCLWGASLRRNRIGDFKKHDFKTWFYEKHKDSCQRRKQLLLKASFQTHNLTHTLLNSCLNLAGALFARNSLIKTISNNVANFNWETNTEFQPNPPRSFSVRYGFAGNRSDVLSFRLMIEIDDG